MGAAVLVNYKTESCTRATRKYAHNKIVSGEEKKKKIAADRLLIKNIGLYICIQVVTVLARKAERNSCTRARSGYLRYLSRATTAVNSIGLLLLILL
jgi:hypothetical protein